MTERQIRVRPLSAQRRAELLAMPSPEPEGPTKFSGRSDADILQLDLDSSLSHEDARAITAEMSRRGLYGN